MGRRSTPDRIHQARRAATRNRLLSGGSTAEVVDDWLARWEAESVHLGLDQDAHDYWQRGYAWIAAQPPSGRG